ncbi:HEAT repeat domain-containing protein [Chloroflexus aggregans]|uniref:HEAT domain containing protein n=1 Tax=Chloroflexus aggregans (strain MD-66 / DSM 9485) TaxID=326427 RepID=B8G3C0_CHLAD|nr:HEAT repeat domain-containing protein [Chloroflexus aggregans]ACL25293.1 HEAT domain containing protein [Chloroflexus aggregans DSM 9485]
MFDRETWRQRIAERFNNFARNPRQEIQVTGVNTVLGFLAVRALEPFLEAFQDEPVAAVLTLAEISRGPGANHLVRRAFHWRYQLAQLIERELRSRPELRITVEEILMALNVIHLARQRLNSSRDEWLRLTLLAELDTFEPGDFEQLRRQLHDPGWQSRYEAIRRLRVREGNFTAADLVLLHDGLSDSASHVRAAAARTLGLITGTPPQPLVKTLIRLAIHDCDLETRFAAARTLGQLRDRIASPQLIDYLVECLEDPDSFVRSAAALVVSQLGEMAGTGPVIDHLLVMLNDVDAYARESAARALGRLGVAAATSTVLNALAQAVDDADPNVHEAAVDAIARLRKLRATLPLTQSRHPTEPLAV